MSRPTSRRELQRRGALIALATSRRHLDAVERFQAKRDQDQADLWPLDASAAWWRSINHAAADVLRELARG